MRRSRSRLRVVAALLACVGMLVWPWRTVAACPMPSLAEQVAGMHHNAPESAMDDHAGHDMTAMHTASSQAPTSQETPIHESCPDLAHCAMVAVPTPLAMVAAPTLPVMMLAIATQHAPVGVAIALEPPPPKA